MNNAPCLGHTLIVKVSCHVIEAWYVIGQS